MANGKLARWQDAGGLGPSGYSARLATGGRSGWTFATRAAAASRMAMLQRTNPRREFKVSQVKGPRGGISYMISVKLTDAEYRRESSGF